MTNTTRQWRLATTNEYETSLKKLDRTIAVRITKKLYWLARQENPESLCKPLTGDLAGLWRVRAGDYRIIIDIQQTNLIIVGIDAGHRSKIYV
jgi:mRNA interferase RelE/StbE